MQLICPTKHRVSSVTDYIDVTVAASSINALGVLAYSSEQLGIPTKGEHGCDYVLSIKVSPGAQIYEMSDATFAKFHEFFGAQTQKYVNLRKELIRLKFDLVRVVSNNWEASIILLHDAAIEKNGWQILRA